MKLTKAMGLALAATMLAAITSLPAEADRHDGWHGDIRHFESHDMGHWRGGNWHHGRHDGQLGWWWVVAGAWYFYPQPVYPYPDPYQPPVVVVQSSSPPAPSAAPQPSTAQYWYYCEAAKGYYPYVPSCPGGWKAVPATPPGAPAQ
jgi:hypothetical protein